MPFPVVAPCRRSHAALAILGFLAAAGAGTFPGPATAGPDPGAQTLASATLGDVQHEWQRSFARELEARTGDALRAELRPGGVLGPIPGMVADVRAGRIEAFVTPTGFLVQVAPVLEVFEIPGIIASPEHLTRMLRDDGYRDHLEALILDSGLRIIGAFTNSPVVMLSREPVETLEQMRGLTLRTFDSPLQSVAFEALGADPVPMPLNLVEAALRDGRIDAALAGMPVLAGLGLYRFARHATDLGLPPILSVTVVNESWLRAQPEALRAAILAAGRAADRETLARAPDIVALAEQDWRGHDGTLLSLDDADRARLSALLQEAAAPLLAADPVAAAAHARLSALAAASR